jgi:hypothetical protein
VAPAAVVSLQLSKLLGTLQLMLSPSLAPSDKVNDAVTGAVAASGAAQTGPAVLPMGAGGEGTTDTETLASLSQLPALECFSVIEPLVPTGTLHCSWTLTGDEPTKGDVGRRLTS